MYHIVSLSKKLVLSSFFIGTAIAAQAQTCTQTASGSNINVASGQVVCVTSNLTANVDIASGGTLKVENGSTLTIQNFNNFNGTLINNGVVVAGNINYGSGAIFTNFNKVTINGNQNYNGTATVNNKQLAEFTVNGTFSLGSSSTINNDGTYISTTGDVSFNSGTLNNNGRFEVRSGNFNPNGTVVNNGFFKVNNFINFNGGIVTNHCRFVSGNGFNVNSGTSFTNDGLVWVTNTTSGKIQINSGTTWMNTTRAKVRGYDIINNGTVSGSGEFYFTGDTRQQGTFAGSYANVDSAIKFYDTTYSPNVTGSVFDFGLQGAGVVRSTMLVPGDTNGLGSICNQQTFDLIPTPLSLNLLRFNAASQGGDVLLGWETADEKGTKEFEIEYSRNGSSWERLGSVTATGAESFNSYQFTHFGVRTTLNLYRLKMIDFDGKFSYSPVKTVSMKDNGSELTVYPNPTKESVNLEYLNSDQQDYVKIFISDVTGKVVSITDWKLAEGVNNNSVSLKKLADGVYFVTLKNNINGATMLQRKIIKN